jgi:FkbM family methyltransferase
MASLQRTVATKLGDLLGIHVVRKGRAGPLLEQDVLETFMRRFEIDCVFDVGANAGQYARMLRRFGYRGTIVSFEPIPKLAARIRTQAASDGNWFVEELALDETVRTVDFHIMLSDQFSSMNAPSHETTPLFQNANVVGETIAVQTGRFDEVFARYQTRLAFRRPFLKMDTQGNDLAVARGAGFSLNRVVGIQSELSIKRIYDGQPNFRESIDFYESKGFVLTAFVPNNAGHFPDLVETDCILYNPAFKPS